jgi:hypothetical protein
MEAQLAYIDACSRYVHGVDKRELDNFMDCWTEDAQWNLGEEFGNHRGHDAIEANWHVLNTAFHEMHHGTSNYQVIEFSDGRAVGRCDAFVPGTDAAGVANMACASYVDTIVRGDDGVWRFEKRDITVHYLVPWTNPQGIDPSTRTYAMAPQAAQP